MLASNPALMSLSPRCSRTALCPMQFAMWDMAAAALSDKWGAPVSEFSGVQWQRNGLSAKEHGVFLSCTYVNDFTTA